MYNLFFRHSSEQTRTFLTTDTLCDTNHGPVPKATQREDVPTRSHHFSVGRRPHRERMYPRDHITSLSVPSVDQIGRHVIPIISALNLQTWLFLSLLIFLSLSFRSFSFSLSIRLWPTRLVALKTDCLCVLPPPPSCYAIHIFWSIVSKKFHWKCTDKCTNTQK